MLSHQKENKPTSFRFSRLEPYVSPCEAVCFPIGKHRVHMCKTFNMLFLFTLYTTPFFKFAESCNHHELLMKHNLFILDLPLIKAKIK